MATVYETRDSGDGNRAGLNGLSATRTFMVHLDASSGVPDDYTAKVDNDDDPISPVAARIPVGTPHHLDGFSTLIASDFEIIERDFEIPSKYLVRINYDHPLVPDNPTLEGWSVRMTAATESAEMLIDLDGRHIGGFAYRAPDTPDEGPPEPATHYADTIKGREDLVQVSDAVNPTPVDYYKGVSGLVLTGTSYYLTATMMADARSYRGRVNYNWFFGSEPHHVLCTSVEVVARPADAQITSQTGLKIAYDVSIEFVHSEEEPWTPVERVDTYESGGYESLVRNTNGALVTRSFRIYRTANFYNLLRIFNSTSGNNIDGPIRKIGGIAPIRP